MSEEDVSFHSATRDVLIPAAKLLGSSCVDENLAFAKCKAKNSDPEACLELGEAVLKCSTEVLSTMLSKCPSEFEEYRKCMDKSQMNFAMCRRFEKELHDAYFAIHGRRG